MMHRLLWEYEIILGATGGICFKIPGVFDSSLDMMMLALETGQGLEQSKYIFASQRTTLPNFGICDELDLVSLRVERVDPCHLHFSMHGHLFSELYMGQSNVCFTITFGQGVVKNSSQAQQPIHRQTLTSKAKLLRPLEGSHGFRTDCLMCPPELFNWMTQDCGTRTVFVWVEAFFWEVGLVNISQPFPDYEPDLILHGYNGWRGGFHLARLASVSPVFAGMMFQHQHFEINANSIRLGQCSVKCIQGLWDFLYSKSVDIVSESDASIAAVELFILAYMCGYHELIQVMTGLLLTRKTCEFDLVAATHLFTYVRTFAPNTEVVHKLFSKALCVISKKWQVGQVNLLEMIGKFESEAGLECRAALRQFETPGLREYIDLH